MGGAGGAAAGGAGAFPAVKADATLAASGARAQVLRLRGLFGGVQEDVHEPAFVVGFVVGEIRFDVLERLAQHVQPVAQLVELRPGDDQLVLVEPSFGRPAAGLVIPLTARALAELAGPAHAGGRLEAAPAPTAPIDGYLVR